MSRTVHTEANARLVKLQTMLDVTMRQAAVAVLGQRIREARKEKRWKQKHLAAAVHVEPVTVSRWERCVTTPDLDTIELIAETTDKPLSYFIGDAVPTQQPGLVNVVERLEAAVALLAAVAERLDRSADHREAAACPK